MSHSPDPSKASESRTPIMRSIGLCAVLFAGTLNLSCKQSEPSAPVVSNEEDPVAIQVGEQEIRLSELQAELDFLRQKKSPAAASPEEFLDSSVERLVALEKARALGLDEDIELRRQWENLLIGRLKSSSLDEGLEDLKVTDDEIKAFYEKNKQSYARPAQVHLALLFLPVSKKSTEEGREAVRQKLEEARSIASGLPAGTRGFGAHAMTYSEEATSRFKGGDIGWLQAGETRYRWPEAVVKAGFALGEKGAISEVIGTEEGYYLLKKLDSRDAVVRSLDGRLRATLESAFLKEKRASIESRIKDDWKASSPVILHDEVLSNLEFQPEAGKTAAPATIPAAP